MTAHNTLKYLGTLLELLTRYNQHIHSSINMASADVNNDEVVWRQLLKPSVPSTYRLQPGDFARTSKLLGKDNRQGAFRVKSAKGPVVMRCVHGDGSGTITITWRIGEARVKGRFYEPQLQKVKGLANCWRVAKKLKYKGCGLRRQVLVNWQGVAPDYQTCIPT